MPAKDNFKENVVLADHGAWLEIDVSTKKHPQPSGSGGARGTMNTTTPRLAAGSLDGVVGLPTGPFRCIVADPPWHVKAGPRSLHDKNERSRPLVYPTMTLAEIEALPVSSLADKDAHLYLWTINRYVEQAYGVARAWGFEPSTLLVWAKRPKGRGLGGTWPTFTEFCLFARRGTLKATTRGPSNWWTWTRGKHSAKPEAFQDMVEAVSPGPRLELFARRARPGWTVWGNEVPCKANLTLS